MSNQAGGAQVIGAAYAPPPLSSCAPALFNFIGGGGESMEVGARRWPVGSVIDEALARFSVLVNIEDPVRFFFFNKVLCKKGDG
jgi:hypothetical protein